MLAPDASTPPLPARPKRRVLFLNDTSRNGGPGRTLFFLLKHLDTSRIHRSVVVPRDGVVADLLRDGGVADELAFEPNLIENPIEPWSRAMTRADFEAAAPVRWVRAVGNVGRATAGLVRLASKIKREGIELIFCNGTSANFAGATLARMTGVPAVWHVFYTSIAGPIEGLHARLAASRGVRSILCVSEPTTLLFDHCQDKVRVVHDAIDTAEFDPARTAPCLRAELGISQDTVLFVSQGRVLPRKGYVELIRAVEIAIGRMTAEERSRCRFIVIGDTPEDTRRDHLAECRALASELGLGDVVSFIGYRPDVRPYVSDADVVVVPSVYEDPLPRSVLEGMALGRPVVAFGVGGIPEMIDSGATGLLVEGRPPNLQALANALLLYLREPRLRANHGAAGRVRAVREFDSRVHAAHVLSEMERVLG